MIVNDSEQGRLNVAVARVLERNRALTEPLTEGNGVFKKGVHSGVFGAFCEQSESLVESKVYEEWAFTVFSCFEAVWGEQKANLRAGGYDHEPRLAMHDAIAIICRACGCGTWEARGKLTLLCSASIWRVEGATVVRGR